MLLGYSTSDGEPWPIILPGEDKPINSCKVGEFVTGELLYYAEFYANYKHSGAPFNSGWVDWPVWCLQIIRAFDQTVDEIVSWRQEQSYKKMRVK